MIQNHSGFTAIVAVALVGLLACKKDQPINNPVSNQPTAYYPLQIKGANSSTIYSYSLLPGNLQSVTKINRDSTTSHRIFYNSSNLPEYLTYLVNNNLISQTFYTLNANGEVIKGEVFINEGIWDYDTPSTLKYSYTLTYNSSGQISQVSYYHADGQKHYDELFYYNSEGNISEIHSSDTISLEYDSFNGLGKTVKNTHLFYVGGADPLLFHSKNNLTRIDETPHSYNYNKDNFPTQMTISYPDGARVYTIEYVK